MTALRIATLNCLNLALPGRRFYAGVEPYTPDEYIAKTQWLAAMFDRLAADFILLQEVFHDQALSDVVRQTAGGARTWSFAVPLAGQDNDRPRLGIVWRQPWRPSLESIAEFPEGCTVDLPGSGAYGRFSRPVLRAELALPQFAGGTALSLFNVHLKSRRPDFVGGEGPADAGAETRARLRSLFRRGAEAAALRRLLQEAVRDAPRPVIVAGDFNEGIEATSTRLVADSWCRTEGRVDSAPRLYDAFEVGPAAQSTAARCALLTTLDGDGGAERIDHVLVSEEFVPPTARAVGRVAAVEVLGDHLFERRRHAGGGGPALERIYSDHAAVCVAIEPLA